MSVVTNIVLCYSTIDEQTISAVNEFFHARDYKGLVRCDDPSLPKAWYGGNKHLESEILIGAFNHLNVPDFVSHIQSVKWRKPEQVQMLIREQDNARFRLINLADGDG